LNAVVEKKSVVRAIPGQIIASDATTRHVMRQSPFDDGVTFALHFDPVERIGVEFDAGKLVVMVDRPGRRKTGHGKRDRVDQRTLKVDGRAVEILQSFYRVE
jgi:hypothetical protein